MKKPYTPLTPQGLANLLNVAAVVIEDHAEARRKSCAGWKPERDWACDDCPSRAGGRPRCNVQEEYEAEMNTVRVLRAEAAAKQSIHQGGGSE